MHRILVLRGGALGDFIVTLPALALLRERWPEARIELIGNATAAQLACNRGLINAVHSQHEARWSALFTDAPLPSALASWLAEFDLVISYWPDPDGELRRRFPTHAQQTFLCADAMPTRAPAAAHFCAPLAVLGLTMSRPWYSLRPSRAAGVREGITLHPGSGSPRKNWPLANWRELLARLPGPATVILGEAELSHATRDAIVAEWPSTVAARFSVLEHPPLENLVAHLSRCRLFLGHDSGISHLAAACGAPCVLLFGPTAPDVWAPPAPNVQVLRQGPELSAIPVADVEHAVVAALSGRT